MNPLSPVIEALTPDGPISGGLPPELAIIGRMWRESWQHVIPFLAYEAEVRRVIYTTDAIEALTRQLRKAIKTTGSFPSEDAALELTHLAINNGVPQWTRKRGWTKAMLAFKIQFGDRSPTDHQPAYIDFRTPST